MKLRRVTDGGAVRVEMDAPQGWVPVAEVAARVAGLDRQCTDDVLSLLALPQDLLERLVEASCNIEPSPALAGQYCHSRRSRFAISCCTKPTR